MMKFNSTLTPIIPSATNTEFNNLYYGENKDVIFAFRVGVAFGLGGTYVGNKLSTNLAPVINPNVSILFQNYDNANGILIGNGVSAGIGGIGSFVDIPDAKK